MSNDSNIIERFARFYIKISKIKISKIKISKSEYRKLKSRNQNLEIKISKSESRKSKSRNSIFTNLSLSKVILGLRPPSGLRSAAPSAPCGARGETDLGPSGLECTNLIFYRKNHHFSNTIIYQFFNFKKLFLRHSSRTL